jgi:hypothetical protein
VSRRIKKIRSIVGENASDAGLNSREEMLRPVREILHKSGVEISGRFYFSDN